MEQPSREEIALLDKAHARADQAIAQIEAGHIITECTVLFFNETKNSEDVIWKGEELSGWPTERAEMIRGIAVRARAMVAVCEPGIDLSFFTAKPDENDLSHEGLARGARGHMMYRKSAAFLAVHPAPDPYTKGDRAGEADRA